MAVEATSASEQQRVKVQLHQLLASYRRDGQARRLRSLSLDGRDYELRHWIDWLETEGRLRKLDQLATDDVAAFLAVEQERLAASTVATMYNHLHAFCSWLVREGFMDRSLMASMRSPKVPQKVTPILTHEEVSKLLKACEGKRFYDRRDYALVRTLLDTGLRVSELLSIRWAHVDLDHQILKVVGKGGDERMVAYGTKTMQALDRYLNVRAFHRYADNAALWLSQQGAIATSTVRVMLRKRGEKAGLYMWPHRLRHQMAHEWLASGGQERDLMKLAGWKSPAMLARYGSAAATQRAIEAFKEHGPGDKF